MVATVVEDYCSVRGSGGIVESPACAALLFPQRRRLGGGSSSSELLAYQLSRRPPLGAGLLSHGERLP
ncbi:hypothetical protein MTO96_027472 [Rhipicephalus appendiculatus]